jgi:DNA-binding MarR family transcriptional regulator
MKVQADRDDVDVIRAEVAGLTRELYRQATALAARVSEASGMHPTDLRALRALDAVVNQPLTAGELARTLGLSSAAVTGVIDRLEAAGLAERVADPEDRRRVRIRLGETARRLGQSQLAPIAARIEQALSELEDDQVLAVHRFLSVLTREEAATSLADSPTPTDPNRS